MICLPELKQLLFTFRGPLENSLNNAKRALKGRKSHYTPQSTTFIFRILGLFAPCNPELISLGAFPIWVGSVGMSREDQHQKEAPRENASLLPFSATAVNWKVLLWTGKFSEFGWEGSECGPEENSKRNGPVISSLAASRLNWALCEGKFAFSVNGIVSGLCPKATYRCWNSSSNTKSSKLMSSEMKLFHLSKSVCQILKSNRAYAKS